MHCHSKQAMTCLPSRPRTACQAGHDLPAEQAMTSLPSWSWPANCLVGRVVNFSPRRSWSACQSGRDLLTKKVMACSVSSSWPSCQEVHGQLGEQVSAIFADRLWSAHQAGNDLHGEPAMAGCGLLGEQFMACLVSSAWPAWWTGQNRSPGFLKPAWWAVICLVPSSQAGHGQLPAWRAGLHLLTMQVMTCLVSKSQLLTKHPACWAGCGLLTKQAAICSVGTKVSLSWSSPQLHIYIGLFLS
jgi:hypothetical protein